MNETSASSLLDTSIERWLGRQPLHLTGHVSEFRPEQPQEKPRGQIAQQPERR